MAVGTVSSQQTTAAAAKQPTLAVGVQVASSLAGVQSGKTYYHRVPGARTHLPDGREIVFLGGMFSTTDPDIIAELDRVADQTTSMIFTAKTGVENTKAAEDKVAADAGNTAANAT